MLKATFCCFTGIGESAEQRLWMTGILEWRHAQKWPEPIFSPGKWRLLRKQIEEAQLAYEAGMLDYFLNRMSGVQKVRVLADVAEGSVGYLDIETDGLGKNANVTTIALHSNGKTRIFVRDVNFADFLPTISECKLLITYNGASFDLPQLRRHFRIDLNIPHLDLMHVLRGMGCRGGLKAAEKALGVKRQHTSGSDGKDAIRLWNQYRDNSDRSALKALILYNAEDVIVLKELASIAYRHAMSSYPDPIKYKSPVSSANLMEELLFDNRIATIYS